MGNNPILFSDPMGDTTRVYNMEGVLVGSVNDSYGNQDHFVKNSGGANFLIATSEDANLTAALLRGSSEFFIGANTREQLQAITEQAETEGLERGFVLSYSSKNKELQATDITGNRDRTNSSFDFPLGLDGGNNIIAGHAHVSAGVIAKGTDFNNIVRVHTPTTKYKALGDFQSLLSGDTNRAYPQMITSSHGYSIYTSSRKTPAGSSHPYPMQILSSPGRIYNWSGSTIVK